MAILPLLVGRFKVARAAGVPIPSVSKQVGEGLRFLWHQRLLRLLALMPLVATKQWSLSPTGYGALAGALGVGGLVGTLSVSTANRLFGRRWVMFANVFLTCSMMAVPAVTANVWAAGAAAFLGGMGRHPVGGQLPQHQPDARERGDDGPLQLGRPAVQLGPLALGAALAGALAQWLGYRPAFGVFAVATAVVIIPFLRTFTPAVLAELESGMSAR
jgi:predicted MFS family arabinose efflux permease